MLITEKSNAGLITLTNKAKLLLNEARHETDPHVSLELFAQLMEGKITRIYKAVAYSQETGEPTRFAWRPYKKWDGILAITRLEGGWPTISEEYPAFAPIMKYLKGNKTRLIEGLRAPYAVALTNISGHAQGGEYSSEHIKFSVLE